MIPGPDFHSAFQHHDAPVEPHNKNRLGSPAYLFPMSPTSIFDSWDDATASKPLPPTPLSPTGMGSFVNKAKAMLRAKRNSFQSLSNDVGPSSGGLNVHRVQSSYHVPLDRPAPKRQTTAPLLSRRVTNANSSTRPPLKKTDGFVQISSPVLLQTSTDFKNYLSINPELPPSPTPAFQPFTPMDSPVQSPPLLYSDADSQHAHDNDSSLPRSITRGSMLSTQFPSDILRKIHEANMFISTRPKSDVFPRSVTISSFLCQDEHDPTVRLKTEVLATLGGYDSNGSPPGDHTPFEFDSPTREDSGNLAGSTSILQGSGLGVSETMMAISNAGMLHDSGTYRLTEDTTELFHDTLGNMFLDDADENDCETEQACESSAAHSSGLETHDIDDVRYRCEDRKNRLYGSCDMMDEYLDFGENALLFSIRAREYEELPSRRSNIAMSQSASDVLAMIFLHRPMDLSQCLESMESGGAIELLTPWRAQLDPTCELILSLVDTERQAQLIANKDTVSEQNIHLDHLACYHTHLNPIRLLPVTKSSASRARLHSTLTTPLSIQTQHLIRCPNTSHAQHTTPSSPGPLELRSSPLAPNVSIYTPAISPNQYGIASSSRIPPMNSTTITSTIKKRRNTREMFIESQVSHAMKGSCGTGSKSRTRNRPRALVTPAHKSMERLEIISADGFSRFDDEEHSTDWIAVPSTPVHLTSISPKPSVQRTLYMSPGDRVSSEHKQNGMNNASSVRGRIFKSPPTRPSPAKSGSRQGLSASQSRSALHLSQPRSHSRGTTRAHTHGSPSSSRQTQFPISPSTRSLLQIPEAALTAAIASPPSRPPRSRVRPRPERRCPSFGDAGEKETLPSECMVRKECEEETIGPNSPVRRKLSTSRPVGSDRQVLGRPSRLHTPIHSTLGSSQRQNPYEPDVIFSTRSPAAETSRAGLSVRRVDAPALPPRSPARAAVVSKMRNFI